MVPLSLVPALGLLFFYVSAFRSMCAMPNMAVFCSSLTSWSPGILLTYYRRRGCRHYYYYYYYYYYNNYYYYYYYYYYETFIVLVRILYKSLWDLRYVAWVCPACLSVLLLLPFFCFFFLRTWYWSADPLYVKFVRLNLKCTHFYIVLRLRKE
jgi:hypothetical protein